MQSYFKQSDKKIDADAVKMLLDAGFWSKDLLNLICQTSNDSDLFERVISAEGATCSEFNTFISTCANKLKEEPNEDIIKTFVKFGLNVDSLQDKAKELASAQKAKLDEEFADDKKFMDKLKELCKEGDFSYWTYDRKKIKNEKTSILMHFIEHCCSRVVDMEALKHIIDNEVEVNFKSEIDNKNVLHYAIESTSELAVYKTLFKAGVEIPSDDEKEDNLIELYYNSCKSREKDVNDDLIRYLLKKGAKSSTIKNEEIKTYVRARRSTKAAPKFNWDKLVRLTESKNTPNYDFWHTDLKATDENK